MADSNNLVEDIARAYDAIFQVVQQAAAPLLADAGLTLAQLRMMFVMRYRAPLSMGDLAEHLEIGLPTASYHVERLVIAGLVERAQNKADRRSTFTQLTPAGVEMVNRFQRRRLDQLMVWLVQLTPEEQHMLSEGLTALVHTVYKAELPRDQNTPGD